MDEILQLFECHGDTSVTHGHARFEHRLFFTIDYLTYGVQCYKGCELTCPDLR
jgi:hypothetical protein